MAWTTILNSVISAGKILTQDIMFALRDNLEAVAQGLTGAPKIQTAALQDGLLTVAKLPAPTAGTRIIDYQTVTPVWNATPYTPDEFNFICNRTGTYSFRIIQRFAGASSTVELSTEIIVNGAAGTVYDLIDNGTQTLTTNVNISLTAGDTVWLNVRADLNGNTVTDSSVKFYIACNRDFKDYFSRIM